VKRRSFGAASGVSPVEPAGPSRRDGVAWFSQGMASVPADDGWLTDTEAAWVARMRYPKRRSEFRLGRWTAKRALALWLALPEAPAALRRVEIDRAPDGAPAPRLDGGLAPVSVSMTDRADWAVCIVGPPRLGLGCDLELVEPRSAGFVADYLTPAEQDCVAARPEGRDVLANLIWSAKESALKVLRTGLRRDTRSVEVTLGPAGTGDGWTPLLVESREGSRFPGFWRRYGAFLLTCAATEPFAPPTPLLEPPGLALAAPSHLWMVSPGPTPGLR
jgi:4'-phosphopantetheinyl transferase